MKKECFFLFLLLFLTMQAAFAQAYLGYTSERIISEHPDISFAERETQAKQKYLVASMDYGTFAYYFGSDGMCNYCVQLAYSDDDANTQAGIYDHNYTRTTENTWEADMETGKMYIKRIYLADQSQYQFTYSFNPN